MVDQRGRVTGAQQRHEEQHDRGHREEHLGAEAAVRGDARDVSTQPILFLNGVDHGLEDLDERASVTGVETDG